MPPLPASVHVAVIGGGVGGLAVARALRERGDDDVVVLEASAAPGTHASGKNAGLARQLVDDDAGTQLTAAGVAWLRDRGAAVGFRATGSYLTFDDEAGRAAYAARAARAGVEVRPVELDEVQARGPGLVLPPGAVGLAVPGDGVFAPAALVAELARGALVVGDAAVTAGRPDGDGVVLTTRRGEVRADVVVVAAGAWSATVGVALGAAPPALRSIKRHVHLAAVDVDADRPFVWHLGRAQGYARPHPGGVLLSACDGRLASPDDVEVDVDTTAALRPWAPQLAAAPGASRWACLRTFGPGDQPVIAVDATRPWLVWMAGLGGHGATGAVPLGRRAAALIRGRSAR